MTSHQKTKSAIIALFGPPNAGKSTFLNTILKEKLAPVHAKPQMTRKNLLGILTEEDVQLVFIDTPGFHSSQQLLNKRLHDELMSAVKDCDVVLVFLDTSRELDEVLRNQIHEICQKKDVVFVLNKKDLPEKYKKNSPENIQKEFTSSEIFLISATKGKGLDELIKALKHKAPEGPFFYSEDEFTTATMREIAVNIIQEKIMEFLKQELPYECVVSIESYKETPEKDIIHGSIIVNRTSQKGMVIGKGGEILKKIGQAARLELQKFLQKKVQLKLFVKVDKNWLKKDYKISDYYGFPLKRS